MTAKDVTVAPKILSGNSVPKEKGYGMYCIYLLEKLSCTPLLDDNGHDLVGLIIKNTNTLSAVRTIRDKEAKFLQEIYTVIQQGWPEIHTGVFQYLIPYKGARSKLTVQGVQGLGNHWIMLKLLLIKVPYS